MGLLRKRHDYIRGTTSLYLAGVKLLTKRRYIGGGGGYYLFDALFICHALSANERFCIKNRLVSDCASYPDAYKLGSPAKVSALLHGLDNASKDFVREQATYLLAAHTYALKTYVNLGKDEQRQMEAARKVFTSFAFHEDSLGGSVYSYGELIFPFSHEVGIIEPQLISSKHNLHLLPHLDKAKAVIDAGAFIGDSALIFARLCGITGEIHSFEPDPINYVNMLRLKELNGFTGLVPVPLGLGSKKERLAFSSDGLCSKVLSSDTQVDGAQANGWQVEGGQEGGAVKNSAVENGGHEDAKSPSDEKAMGGSKDATLMIETTTIDAYVSENALEIGLIKSDVEGYEMELLHGALETIKAQRPALLISIYHSIDDYLGIKPFLEEFFAAHGLRYAMHIYKDAGGYNLITDTCLYCDPLP